MKRRFISYLFVLAVSTLCLSSFVSDAAPNKFGKYLSAADIQQVTGMKTVKSVAKDPAKGFGGDLNFAAGNGNALLMVQIVGKEQYQVFKKYGNGGAVKALGNEAVQGATIPGFPPNYVCFIKGSYCVALTTYINNDDPSKTMLALDQLIALAKIIASRI